MTWGWSQASHTSMGWLLSLLRLSCPLALLLEWSWDGRAADPLRWSGGDLLVQALSVAGATGSVLSITWSLVPFLLLPVRVLLWSPVLAWHYGHQPPVPSVSRGLTLSRAGQSPLQPVCIWWVLSPFRVPSGHPVHPHCCVSLCSLVLDPFQVLLCQLHFSCHQGWQMAAIPRPLASWTICMDRRTSYLLLSRIFLSLDQSIHTSFHMSVICT